MTRRPGAGSLAGLTLQGRLLAALVTLLALISIVIGAVSVVALDQFLLTRLDAQVAQGVQRTSNALSQHPDADPRDSQGSPGAHGPSTPADGGPPGFLDQPGYSAGTLGAEIVAGTTTEAGVTDALGASHALPAAQQALLARLPTDGVPRSLDLGGGYGDYRVAAVRMTDGDVFITGLPLSGVQATVYRLAAVVATVALCGLLAAGLAGAAIVRLALRPLRSISSTAARVSELALDRGEVALSVRVPDADADPRTEVGQVGLALNRMLGHIGAALAARQASETRVRRFVADASHELRTPLASIRGYAELTRRSRDTIPPEVARSLERVESEARRMTALVDDLLLLARLDTGQEQADTDIATPVDLTRLVIDTVSDAHATAPTHLWRIDVPDQPVTVHGDPARLHQVLANLLANARAHTPAGTTVTVRLRPGPETMIEVTDDGPGIPADLVPEVFTRFARGDSSRSRSSGSTGLGLAIVTAIVEAHHGQVSAASAPGRTTFTVRLPA